MSGYHPIHNPFFYVTQYAQDTQDARVIRNINKSMDNLWLNSNEYYCVNAALHFYDNPNNWSRPMPNNIIQGLNQAYSRQEPGKL